MTLRGVVVNVRAVVVVVAVALAGAVLDACGIFDGLFWQSAVTSQQLCDRVNTIEAQSAQCRSEQPQSVCSGSSDVDCIHQRASVNCHNHEYENLLDCLFVQAHQCTELPPVSSGEGEGEGEGAGAGASGNDKTANGFCAQQFAALNTCASLQTGCNGTTNPVNGSCNNNGVCEGNEDPNNCPDCCNHDGNCEPNESPQCSDCGFQGACNHDSICDGPNETQQSCPQDCQASPCNHDNVCDGNENNVGCPDCTGPCNHDGNCEQGEPSSCNDCSSSALCASFPCPGGKHCEVQAGVPQCVPDSSGACNNDGRCEAGEDNTSCPSDCDPCSNDGTCTEREASTCVDCAGCNNDGVCAAGEPSTCPDCVCNHDGQCNNAETNANCGSDCVPCNRDGTCQPNESHLDCSDCGGAAPCNTNSICEGGESTTSCSDCTELQTFGGCNLDNSCESNEPYRCGDCIEAATAPVHAKTCSVAADCDATTACSGANPPLCLSGAPACNERAPKVTMCWPRCTATSQCPFDPSRGLGCMSLLDPNNAGAGSCQPGMCHSINTLAAECPGGACIDALELTSGANNAPANEPLDGLCANVCDPQACVNGTCGCGGVLSRCAPVRTTSSAPTVANYVCIPPGPRSVGATCVVETDCANNSVCAGGVCVPMHTCAVPADCPPVTPNCGPRGVCER